MGMTYVDKIAKAKKLKILIPEDILIEDIVGIYGFFALKDSKESCFYIGKATNIRSRLLDASKGHIHRFLYGYDGLVPDKIRDYRNDNYSIEVKVLERIDYEDTNFSRAAHRLALAELQQIVKYQKDNQCLEQRPEGVGPNEMKYWESNYKKQE